MFDTYISLNGQICTAEGSHLKPLDRGLLYGDGLFETMRIYAGVPFRLYAHWERLCEAASVLRIPMTWSYEDLEDCAQALLTANERSDGAMRLSMTRGPAQGGLDPHPEATPTFLMTTQPLRTTLKNPCRLITVSARRDETSPLSRIKSINYLPNILARFEVKDKDADEGLLLNTRGAVAEGTVSNIFWIKGQILFTPSVECGILPGITRAAVMEEAEQAGLLTAEGAFDPSTLQNVDALFLTNALIEIVPVYSLDGQVISDHGKQAVESIQSAFRQLVMMETGSENV